MVLFACVVVMLWLNGRYWRRQWTLEPSFKHYETTSGNSKVLVIAWTGAFNHGPTHFERMVSLYQCYGDVYVVEYAFKRFDRHAAMRVAYQYAYDNGYENIVLVGASLGGEECLMFAEYARAHGAIFADAMVMIPADTPLDAEHLFVPPALSRMAKYVHIGPFFNLLSPLLARIMFRPIKPRQTNGVDQAHWDRHMGMMWSCKLSVIAEQISAIAWMWRFTNVQGIPTVYLCCTKDEVIRGEKAASDWKSLLGESLLEIVYVEGGHVQLVENHLPWSRSYTYALELLREKGLILAA